MRLIDADALWKKMQTQYTDGSTDDEDRYYVGINVGITKCHNLMMNAPTIDIPHGDDWEAYSERLWKRAYERGKADRPQGEWIDAEIPLECGGSMPIQVCNLCKTFYPLAYTGGGHRFCPNCGCQMKGEQDE